MRINLPELIEEEVITKQVADQISDFYSRKKEKGVNKLFVIFGVLGALLVGLGILLIIAHNWDTLTLNIKAILAFVPLLVAQILCGWLLVKKSDSMAWKEGAATFLFISVGASISLVSQIYHISGDLSTFLLVWMSLSLPVIYLMNSSFASLLYLIGITCYSCEAGYWSNQIDQPYLYWILLILAIPYYLMLVKRNNEGNFVRFHNLLIVMSIVISLGTVAKTNHELMYIAYLSLFAIFLLIEGIPLFQKSKDRNLIFEIAGFSGSMIILFILSFSRFWNHLAISHHAVDQLLFSREMIPVLLTTLIALVLLYKKIRTQALSRIRPIGLVFLIYILIYVAFGSMPSLAIIFINTLILFLGVSTIIIGLQLNHIGVLNLGLLIITVLIICRFFDTELSFMLRGFLFIGVGIGFFLMNYRMLKSRKNEN